MRFWTALQSPFSQAAFIKNGKIVKTKPEHRFQTPTKQVVSVSEFGDKLILGKHSSYEIWDKEGENLLGGSYHKNIYLPHGFVSIGKDLLLVISTGLDLIFIMDYKGDVKWEWWAYENGIALRNRFYFSKNWEVDHVSGRNCMMEHKKMAHFNSAFLMGNAILVGCLMLREIIKINLWQQGYEHVAQTSDGVHSPIYSGDKLIYGTKEGIMVGKKRMLKKYKWVKYIRETDDGFIFTCQEGLIFTDKKFQDCEKTKLPGPFQFAFMER